MTVEKQHLLAASRRAGRFQREELEWRIAGIRVARTFFYLDEASDELHRNDFMQVPATAERDGQGFLSDPVA